MRGPGGTQPTRGLPLPSNVDTAEKKAAAETLLQAVKGVDAVENAIRVLDIPLGT